MVGVAEFVRQQFRRRSLRLVAGERIGQDRHRVPRIGVMDRNGAVAGSPPRSASSRWCRANSGAALVPVAGSAGLAGWANAVAHRRERQPGGQVGWSESERVPPALRR